MSDKIAAAERDAVPDSFLKPVPATTIQANREAFRAAVRARLTGRDTYRDKNGLVKLRKEGYLKLARDFNIQFDIKDRQEHVVGDEYEVISQCHAYVRDRPHIHHVATGSCSWKELAADNTKPTKHIVRARADTRAEKRALEALLAPGDFLPEPDRL